MEYYILIIAILVLLGISDLIVGVSNDAVNFLNNAFGSKVASRSTILIVASAGILAGCFFAGEMMQVTRNGIFNPAFFSLNEILIICLAVMFTDVILIDRFNFFALPTSTTVSLIFELLGASLSISILKISQTDQPVSHLANLINTDKAFFIISGIFLSVAFAFTIGAIVQFISRIVFSFRTTKSIRYFGSVFGGMAMTAIIYFVLIQSTHGNALWSHYFPHFTKNDLIFSVILIFIFLTAVIELLVFLFRINILKTIILAGTFALALAFASNDLVNFIGVPLTGYEAFKLSSYGADNLQSLSQLNNPVAIPYFILFLSALIMIFSLWFSGKADIVTKTTIDLSRQQQGYERFRSTLFSRIIVNKSIKIIHLVNNSTPNSIRKFVKSRFEYNQEDFQDGEKQAFDYLRAAINLIVASILISIGTSYVLPLSTTYVTFMVAMGTSLADGAWDRDSAVYRISGMFTVIGGWFITAFIAFIVSLMVALFIGWLKLIAVIILIGLAFYILLKSNYIGKLNKTDNTKNQSDEISGDDEENPAKIIEHISRNNTLAFIDISKIFYLSANGILLQDLKQLKSARESFDLFNTAAEQSRIKLFEIIKKLNADNVECGQYYIQMIDHLKNITQSLDHITQMVYNHVINNHKPLANQQKSELSLLNDQIAEFFNLTIFISREKHFDEIQDLKAMQNDILIQIEIVTRSQIKRIRKDQSGTRLSLLYFDLLTEIKNVVNLTCIVVALHSKLIELLKKQAKQNNTEFNRDIF